LGEVAEMIPEKEAGSRKHRGTLAQMPFGGVGVDNLILLIQVQGNCLP
jgi:hypothetical protein